MMKIMLDSGAFSAWRRGVKIDIDQYAEFIKKNGHLFECCVNLDVIKGDNVYDVDDANEKARKSYNNWMYLQRLGVDTLPVFHLGTDEKWLEKYLRKTDYVAVGGIAKTSQQRRLIGLDRVWRKYLLDAEGRPLTKVHGMGMTSTGLLCKYPWYSADSITPILAAGFGSIFLPVVRDGEFDFLNMTPYNVSDQFRHESTNFTSYSRTPKLHRDRWEEYMKELGFEIGKIHGVKSRLRSAKKKEKPEGFFIFEEEEIDENGDKTLANHGEERRMWNLLMWDKMGNLLPKAKTILYVGGTFDVLNDVISSGVSLSFLFSYIVVNDNFIPRLKETLNVE